GLSHLQLPHSKLGLPNRLERIRRRTVSIIAASNGDMEAWGILGMAWYEANQGKTDGGEWKQQRFHLECDGEKRRWTVRSPIMRFARMDQDFKCLFVCPLCPLC
ncbi:MAG: hypothetical protein QGG09_02820, partial [Pirellulaceae bacterium]|nr:hypothetical protein [Pirellulaceae bacterium]